MKALVGTFNQEKALVRGLLCNCEIFANLRCKLITHLYWGAAACPWRYHMVRPGGLERDTQVRVRLPTPASSSELVCRSIVTEGLSATHGRQESLLVTPTPPITRGVREISQIFHNIGRIPLLEP